MCLLHLQMFAISVFHDKDEKRRRPPPSFPRYSYGLSPLKWCCARTRDLGAKRRGRGKGWRGWAPQFNPHPPDSETPISPSLFSRGDKRTCTRPFFVFFCPSRVYGLCRSVSSPLLTPTLFTEPHPSFQLTLCGHHHLHSTENVPGLLFFQVIAKKARLWINPLMEVVTLWLILNLLCSWLGVFKFDSDMGLHEL